MTLLQNVSHDSVTRRGFLGAVAAAGGLVLGTRLGAASWWSEPQAAEFTPNLFLSIDGVSDTARAAIEIVDRANVGLAPGSAFGRAGEGFFRLCFHRRHDHLEEAAHRLVEWAAARRTDAA